MPSPELSPFSPTTPATSPHPSLERRGIRDPLLPLSKGELEGVAEEKVASISPSLSSVESLRTSLPESYQSLFDTLRKEVMDFCGLHSIPTSSLKNHEALREATKHLSNSDLEHLSLVLKRLEYLIVHKEPMPEKKVSLTQEQAREIMGENMLDTFEVEEHFCKLSPEQEEAFSVIPFSKETLEACAETHILVADIGIPLLDIRKIKTAEKLFQSQDQDWYNNEEFAKRTERATWRLIRKTPVDDSFDKTWDEQQSLIDQETDEVPTVRQLVYTIILRRLATRERLFDTGYVRTRDVGMRGIHIYVWFLEEEGLEVNFWQGDKRIDYVGLSSTRKFDF